MSPILVFNYEDCERKKKHQKVTSHCHFNCKFRDGVTSICNLKFNVPNEVGNGNIVIISYKIKFIDRAIFMASSLSNFAVILL